MGTLARGLNFSALLFSFLLQSFIASAQVRPFDQKTEFPNLFLPKEYRALASSQVPASVVTESRTLVERALQSMNLRMTVPIMIPGEARATPVRYFGYVQKELQTICSDVRIFSSGGVVRSQLTYLYALIRSSGDRDQALQSVIDDASDLPASDFRGIGSDFDILLDGCERQFKELSERLLAITNSAEIRYGLLQSKNTAKRLFFTVGDSKEYGPQTNRSSNQGGSTLDLMAFDIENGRMIAPERFQEVFDDFIRGFISYVGPKDAKDVEDAEKQTIRGIRGLLEAPWLTLKDEVQLRQELERIIQSVEAGRKISYKAIDQFGKMIRNARYSGAHNRFYRGAPGSIEALIQSLVSKLELSENSHLLPEFVGTSSIENRDGTEIGPLPRSLFMNRENFVARFTREGTLFHGTPSLENSFAILRKGFFLSAHDQGTAAYGRGVYTTPDLSTARSHAGNLGAVFSLTIHPSSKLNILEWNATTQGYPEIQALVARAKRERRDVFEILAEEHSVDIIINHHVLVQNGNAIECPEGLTVILAGLLDQLMNAKLSTPEKMSKFDEFKRLAAFTADLGQAVPNFPADLQESLIFEELLHYGFGDSNYDRMRMRMFEYVRSDEDPKGRFERFKKIASYYDQMKHNGRFNYDTLLAAMIKDAATDEEVVAYLPFVDTLLPSHSGNTINALEARLSSNNGHQVTIKTFLHDTILRELQSYRFGEEQFDYVKSRVIGFVLGGTNFFERLARLVRVTEVYDGVKNGHNSRIVYDYLLSEFVTKVKTQGELTALLPFMGKLSANNIGRTINAMQAKSQEFFSANDQIRQVFESCILRELSEYRFGANGYEYCRSRAETFLVQTGDFWISLERFRKLHEIFLRFRAHNSELIWDYLLARMIQSASSVIELDSLNEFVGESASDAAKLPKSVEAMKKARDQLGPDCNQKLVS